MLVGSNGAAAKNIKPRDLVRTPEGETAEVLSIEPAGRRVVKVLFGKLRGRLFTVDAAQLYLVRSAPPMPWHSRDLRRYLETLR